MSELRTRAQRSASIWQDNPVLVHLLGLSPVLALSDSLAIAIALLLCAVLVLVPASIVTALLRNPLPEAWRFAWILAILAVLATLLDFLLQVFYPALRQALGFYLPLLCCNFALLLHLDSNSHQTALSARLVRITLLLTGYGLVILVFAGLRELLGRGTLLADAQLLVTGDAAPSSAAEPLFSFALLQPGGLLLLGILVAAGNLLRNRFPDQPVNDNDIVPAERARVTEKLQSGN